MNHMCFFIFSIQDMKVKFKHQMIFAKWSVIVRWKAVMFPRFNHSTTGCWLRRLVASVFLSEMRIARSISSPFDITLIEWLQWHLALAIYMSEWKKTGFWTIDRFFCLLVTCNQLISIVVDGSCQNMRSREAGFFNVGSSLISSFLNCWAGFKGPAANPGSPNRLAEVLPMAVSFSGLAFAGIKRTPDKRGQGKENAEAVKKRLVCNNTAAGNSLRKKVFDFFIFSLLARD